MFCYNVSLQSLFLRTYIVLHIFIWPSIFWQQYLFYNFSAEVVASMHSSVSHVAQPAGQINERGLCSFWILILDAVNAVVIIINKSTINHIMNGFVVNITALFSDPFHKYVPFWHTFSFHLLSLTVSLPVDVFPPNTVVSSASEPQHLLHTSDLAAHGNLQTLSVSCLPVFLLWM